MDLYQSNPQFLLAEKICKTLQKQGYQALLAGGCVRDFLLQRQPNDFDVATQATPDVVEKLFPKTVAVGKAFGVIVVVEGDVQVEVATFRKDGPYVDGRRPQSVEFAEVEEDSRRRDFTVNGLFYDFQTRQVLDYVGGVEDLHNRQLRAIGEPARRFAEDHLRLLRAVRFAAQLGFEIEELTWRQLVSNQKLISSVSGERIQDEISKLLACARVSQGLKLFFECGLLATLLSQKQLNWKSPQPIFAVANSSSMEDLWFRFFFWLRGLLPSETGMSYFENLCDQWKFSRQLKQRSLRALQWTFEVKPFLQHSLGELLSLSFEAENFRGLLAYSEFFLSDQEREAFSRFLRRRQELGSEKPAPWVVASDFAGKLQGEELGRALKTCYWKQLEGQIQSKEDLLKEWRI